MWTGSSVGGLLQVFGHAGTHATLDDGITTST